MSRKPSTPTLENNPETRRILQRVYKDLLAREKKIPRASAESFRMTGLGENAITTFRKGENIDLTPKSIDRSIIHDKLIEFYLTRNILPTSRQLFRALNAELPPYMDVGGFRKLLYKMDYVFLKLQNNVVVVVERPEVTHERLKYLELILEYNQQDLPIYFVEEWAVPISVDSSYDPNNLSYVTGKEKMVFAFSKSNVVLTGSFLLPANASEDDYRNWIVCELIPTLDRKSVIVVNTDYFYNDLFEYPTINSLKVEMTDWLDRHNVPYEENMTKIDLMTLIENCTDVDSKETRLDKLITSLGHIPLKIPRHMNLLTPGSYLFEHLKLEMNSIDVSSSQEDFRSKIEEKMNSLSSEVLNKYINICIDKYMKLMYHDISCDEKFDAKLQNVVVKEYDSDLDSDIDLDSDSD